MLGLIPAFRHRHRVAVVVTNKANQGDILRSVMPLETAGCA